MQRNYIKNASNFFCFYETTEMQNFGLNVFFLTQIQKQGVIVYENLFKFLESNRDALSKTNLLSYISNSTLDLLNYIKALKKIDPQHEPTIDKEKPSHVSSIIHYILNNDLRDISRTNAMFFDTGILSWEDDISLRLGSENKPGACSYKIDEDFQYWPINQIAHYPIYAAMGVTENSLKFPLGGFYYELLNYDQHNQTDIQSIIALGELNVDFPPYFIEPKKCEAIDINGNQLIIEVLPLPIITNDSIPYSQYSLHVKSIEFNHNKTPISYEKTFNLFHISIADGQPIDLINQGLASIIDKVSNSLDNNKGVLVHCRAGLGRTGQVITELILSRKNNFQDLFNTEDQEEILTNINEFVENMREYRPGLILTEQQLFHALHNAFEYQKRKIVQKENLNREKCLASVVPESLLKAITQSALGCESSFWHPGKYKGIDNLAISPTTVNEKIETTVIHKRQCVRK